MRPADALRPLGREARRPGWLRDHPAAPWAAVGAVCAGAFMGQLDASIVTLTYRPLQTQFRAGLGGVIWVSLAYLAVLAVLLVPVGRWADSRGRKLLYLYGFVIFTGASALCALAPSLDWLVAGRAVQGVGAALLQANSVALVVLAVPAHRARLALGIQGAAQGLGLALGPTVGGALVGAWGWRSVFWVNVPVGVVAVLAGNLLLPRSRGLVRRGGCDPAGFGLLAIAVAAALLALSGLSGLALSGRVVVALAVLALLAATALIRVENTTGAPLLDGRLLGRPRVGTELVAAMLAYFVLFAPLVLVPTLFARWRVTPASGGLLLTLLPAGFAATAVASNLVGSRVSNPLRIRLGALGGAVALAVLALSWRTPVTTAVVLLALGACLGVVIPANNAALMAAVPAQSAASIGGLVNVARALGTSLGVAITAIGLHLAAARGWGGASTVALVLAAAALLLAGTAGRVRGEQGVEGDRTR